MAGIFQSLEEVCGHPPQLVGSDLNYFVGRVNNGFAEGVNLKIKMLNRRGFGYRKFKSFRLRVLVAFIPFSR